MSAFILWVAGWFVASALGGGTAFFVLSRLQTRADMKTFSQSEHDYKAQTIGRWVTKNPWYSDPELSIMAQQISVHLAVEWPKLSLEDNLTMVTAEMRRRFPERCGGKLN